MTYIDITISEGTQTTQIHKDFGPDEDMTSYELKELFDQALRGAGFVIEYNDL